jgi:predicted RNase H-like nuclease
VKGTGIDGCRAGWIAVGVDGSDVEVRVGALADVLRGAPRPVAIDVPIGLFDDGASGDRACDKAARARLGRPRASSVFAPPTRKALAARAWRAGLGLSKQAFGLLPAMREVDAWITPARQRWIAEAHPELAFALLAGAPMRHAKRTREGRAERIAALPRAFAGVVRGGPPSGARWDDLLDACALAWTADRIRRGVALRLPARPSKDARGLRMEILA